MYRRMDARSVFWACFLGVVCVNAGVTIKKCPLNDAACFQPAAVDAFRQIIAGVPELGVESSDPLYLKLVEADISDLKYNFSDVTVLGYKDCEFENAKFNLDKGEYVMEMYCRFDLRGQYSLKGRLLVLPVEGEGDFSIVAKRTRMKINAEVRKTDGKDGKTHLAIKKFTFDTEAVDQVTFDFKNLFNGNKELSDGVHKFANENYKEVTTELSGPLFNAALKKVSKNVNKYLKSVPIEDLIL